MTVQIFKEQLNEKYDGVAPATLLPVGALSGGQNVRKVSKVGGWKARKGCKIHNTTQIADTTVLSLHLFKHPRLGSGSTDYHFIAQCNGNLYDAGTKPPTEGGAAFAASTLSALAGTTNPGWSDVVRESWLYADGESAPVMWGGDGPYCEGFVFYDSSETTYVDYTRDVTDNTTVTSCSIVMAANDKLYVASPCRAKAVVFDLGTSVNNNAQTIVLKSWVAGAWDARTVTDGTGSGGPPIDTSMTKDGSVTWTVNATDTTKVINGKMAYWYEISFTGLLDVVEFISVKVLYDPEVMSNKWSGVYETPLAVRFFDTSAGEYVDYTGKLTNESTSQYLQLDAAATGDFLYVKSVEPLCGIGFAVADGYEQTGNAQVDHVEYWNGSAWTEIDIAVGEDETLDVTGDSSFAQTGVVWWKSAGLTVKRRTMVFDSGPGYWYRVSWDAELDGTSNDCRVFMVVVATQPETLPAYKGVIEFKGRAFVWPDPEYPNRLRFSAKGKPDCFSGSDSGYTDEFGDMTEIVGTKRFHNELIVVKKNSIWLLEGFAPENFGVYKIADTVGCCAPKTLQTVETGYPSMHADEPLSIAIWMDTDGVYILDGRKPKKVSLPVDQYFNIEYLSTALAAASLGNIQAFIDRLNNEYHLLTQTTTELVYNFVTDEWYPPWVRTVGTVTPTSAYLICGINLKGTDGRDYCYSGNSEGFVFKLETGTSDKNQANTDVAIEQKIKTRAISAEQKMSTTMEFTFRRAMIEAKARSAGSVTVNFYKDIATSGTALTVPAAPSLVKSGYGLAVDGVDASQQGCKTFQLEFVESTVDVEMELYSFLYLLEVRGEFTV